MTTITIEEAREITDGIGKFITRYLKKRGIDATKYEEIIEDLVVSSIEGWIQGKEQQTERDRKTYYDDREEGNYDGC